MRILSAKDLLKAIQEGIAQLRGELVLWSYNSLQVLHKNRVSVLLLSVLTKVPDEVAHQGSANFHQTLLMSDFERQEGFHNDVVVLLGENIIRIILLIPAEFFFVSSSAWVRCFFNCCTCFSAHFGVVSAHRPTPGKRMIFMLFFSTLRT